MVLMMAIIMVSDDGTWGKGLPWWVVVVVGVVVVVVVAVVALVMVVVAARGERYY